MEDHSLFVLNQIRDNALQALEPPHLKSREADISLYILLKAIPWLVDQILHLRAENERLRDGK